ncbi:Hypothetical predicted protein [Pelobates cultripes]|uniref:Uncharacterized protein n=1 Tax=Pelobates cultripes TaxID=61616 RepID=A0AAD1VWN0_PELCU|nr:Hypothetical predicted protein [Pelobates cultripes]
MATEPDPETDSTCPELLLEGGGKEQQSGSPSSTQAKGDNSAPATKRDIRQLLQEIKKMFDDDINLARTETQAVTAWVQATKEDNGSTPRSLKLGGYPVTTTVCKHNIINYTRHYGRLQLTHKRQNSEGLRLDWPNRIPQYLRWLTAVLLPHTQAKKLNFDCNFCIKKAKQAPPA